VQSLDVSVGLRATGAEAAVSGTERGERVGDDDAAELIAVVGKHAFQSPAGGVRVARDATARRLVCSALTPEPYEVSWTLEGSQRIRRSVRALAY
jgi:hypothetical protein